MRRRVLAAFVVVALVATAWVLLGRGDADRAGRAEVRPAGTPALKKLDGAGKPAPDGGAAAAPGAAKGGANGAAAGAEAPATAQLRVRVVDAAGAPAGGARVEAASTSPLLPLLSFPFAAAPLATATAARDGLAALALAPGSYWVRAAHGDAASFPVLAATGGGEATLVIEPARVLRGIVVRPDGSPAAGFPMQLTLHHAERAVRFGGATGGDGAFGLPALPDAWLDRLVVEVREAAAAKPSEPSGAISMLGPTHWEFDIRREEMLGGTITLRLTVVRIRARVVGEGGIPVGGASVHWAPPAAPDPSSFRFVAVTDEDGRFETAVQRLSGEPFVIRAPGFAPRVWRPEVPSSERTLHVPEIVLRRGVTLAGRVTDTSGRPSRAFVRLESPRLPGQIVAQDLIDDDGRFRFAVEDEEHVLYAFRPVDPDLCLPQLRMDGIRGGADEVHVVLPEPIHGTVRFVAQGTGDAVEVEHLTLIVRDAGGAETAKRTWEPGLALGQVRFEVWQEGAYDFEVYTARQEPARVTGVNVVRGRAPDVAVPLVPRR